MKRSDMIDFISNILRGDFSSVSDASLCDFDLIADCLLGDIEIEGMLPPTIPTRISDPDRYTGYTFYDPPTINPNEWEDE